MKIIIQDTAKERKPELDTLIRRKVRTLSRYAAFVKDAVVEVVHDHHHRKGNVATVDISLHLFCHGNLPLRASSTGSDVHAALDTALDKLKRQLGSHKEMEAHHNPTIIRQARGK
ncbi:ribosome-associated translation inhibitor RaiA [Candidatus Uhrbacteria bacterium]|nr:ribosome-associated translation inhibitor RaiA [Candidatus Uhrbacteria bacterium]